MLCPCIMIPLNPGFPQSSCMFLIVRYDVLPFPVNNMLYSKTCLATVLIRSIFAREKLHERFSASAVFQRKIERINTVARHVLL